ncbi:efflux RND transporter periplasmic adaptor subunit, partial [archaeon]|nr:efflux RND transporter periplasmic adaptor subunit [archaeon]
MRNTLICRVLLFCISVFFLSACSSEELKPPARPVPVVTARAVKKQVPVRIKAIGTVEAYESISVRSQVTGIITKVHFREGQEVKKGDVLLELDNRSYKAVLKQAEANIARDRAQEAKAREDLKRYAMLLERDYVAREQYDQVKADLASLEATVKADDAAVESARVMLQYCTITSPITGRTGRLQVDQGNIVKANDVE